MPIHFANEISLILTSISDSDIPIDLRIDFSTGDFEESIPLKENVSTIVK